MGNGAEEFLLLEYAPNKPAEIGNCDIKRMMKKGKGRYMPFVVKLNQIVDKKKRK